MLIDELREKLKACEPDLEAIKAFYANAKIGQTFADLEKIYNNETFWQNPDQIKISKEFQKYKTLAEEYSGINQGFSDFMELIEMFGDNESELASIKNELLALVKKITSFKIALLLSKPEDASNCYLIINAGAGGTESQDWAHILLRMYVRFCERENFKLDILDYQDGEEAGIKSATLYVKGNNAYGFLKSEAGIHRLVRISPFDANKRRHTSFAGVLITPEVEDVKVEIDEEDLRIDTYRAGGAGGQHVNKTDSAVRITHLPTNIVVQCQNERSQLQNKQTAMKMLMAKLVEKHEAEKHAREHGAAKQKIEWGSQIRSYVMQPYRMVKDHRTDTESPQPELVLDGELMPFIESYLVQFADIEKKV